MAKTLDEHAGYLGDRLKLERYEAAIARTGCSGKSVMDLGCGTGILGLLAVRAGAEKVVFVEEGKIIDVARRTIANAGYSGQAEFFPRNSFELELEARVDIVLCDHVGYFGFDYGLLDLLADARQRFLQPGGTIIPTELEILAAPVESDACRRLVSRWRDGGVPGDYRWVASMAANTKHAREFDKTDLLAGASRLATLELGKKADDFLSWQASFSAERDGRLDGIAGFFNCRLIGDIYMSNSPAGTERLDRPQAFLPLEESVFVEKDETLTVTVMARHRDDIIGWIVELPDQDLKFAGNTFNGLLLDRAALTRAQPDRKAALNPQGRARQIVLSYCDGARTVADVSAIVQKEHPDLFPTERALSTFVTRVLAWDTGA